MSVLPMTGRATIVWPLNPPPDAAARSIQAVAEAIREALRKEDAILNEPALNAIGFQSPIIANTFRGHQLGGISGGIIFLENIENGIEIRYDLSAAPIVVWAIFLIFLLTVLLHTPLFGANPRDFSSDWMYLGAVIASAIKYLVARFSFPRWLRGRVLNALAGVH